MVATKKQAKNPIPYMAFNFMSSVGIITVNKIVFKEYGFTHNIFLTGCHFLITFAGLCVCNLLGMFQIKKVPLSAAIDLSLSFCGFVVFNNLSLEYNSVGFYQLMKVLTTPVIVAIQYVGFGVPLHNKLKICLLPVCLGVILATVNDIEINFWGVVFALCGILSTSFYQIFVKSKQQELGLNPYQLLFYQAPISAVMVFFISLFMDPPYGEDGWMNFNYTNDALAAIMCSGGLAFCVNLSIFLVIGSTSPISYNVLGHFKLVCVLCAGFLYFNEDTNALKVIGTILAFVGVVAYSTVKQGLPTGWEARAKKFAKERETNGKLSDPSARV